MQYVLRLAAFIILLSSCNNYKTKYPYSLADFRPELRKHLEQIVRRNVTSRYYSDLLFTECSLTELKKLFNCEHPIIRACAFPALIRKDSANIENLLFSSLNDTAIILEDKGEWGISRVYCADYYLSESSRKTKIESRRIFDTLIRKYSNLDHTYYFLSEKDSFDEKYYPIIKSIAGSILNPPDHTTTDDYISIDRSRKDVILYALSTYKKNDDVALISNNLNLYTDDHIWQIIQNNPDTAYFKIVEEYYKRLIFSENRSRENLQIEFYKSSYRSKTLVEDYIDFLTTLAKYKNSRSEEMLKEILNKKLYPLQYRKPNSFENDLYDILSRDYCDQHKSVLTAIKPAAMAFKKQYDIPLDRESYPHIKPSLENNYW